MKNGLLAGLGVLLAIVLGFWLLILVVKVTLKLIGIAIILGLGAALYFAVRKKLGGGDAR
jgi:hypothetical protein